MEETEKPIRRVPIQRYTLKDLCNLYEVHRNTFRKWLKPFEKELGKRIGYYYTVNQVELIFKKLDMPHLSWGGKVSELEKKPVNNKE